ncbi:MAG: GNAT family N-acetyltransferase [bacterium]
MDIKIFILKNMLEKINNIKRRTLDDTLNSFENLDIKIELATPEDWQDCKKLRLEALNSEDAYMLGDTSQQIKVEEAKTEEQWRKELSSNDMFTVLSKNNLTPVGIGRAEQYKKGIWILYNGYLEKEFQGKGIGRKNFAMRLKIVKERGGIKVTTGIKRNNDRSMSVAKYFNFKVLDALSASFLAKKIILPTWKVMECDLNDPEVIKKINEVLNEG